MEEEKNIIPEQKKEEPKAKGNGLLVTILLILVLALAGYIVYDKVIKNDNPEEQIEEKEKKEEQQEEENKEENKQEETKEETKTIIDVKKLAGHTFKTKDGKKTLKIVSKTDSQAIKDAKKYEGIDVDGDFDYFAYYNGTLFTIYGDADQYIANSKYHVIGGEEKGNGAQCRDSHQFVINLEDGSLVNLRYDRGDNYIVHKAGNTYYFSEGDCALAFLSHGVYNEDLKKVGVYYFNSDQKDNSYILDKYENGSIVKYDKTGKIVKTSSQKYSGSDINQQNVSYKDTIYVIGYINKVLYLIDGTTEEKYKLEGLDNYFSSPGMDAETINGMVENDLVKIYYWDFDDDNNEKKVIVYTFNPTTKELNKN